MLVARRAIPPRAKFAILLPGDAPLIRTETLAASLALSRANPEPPTTILSADMANPAYVTATSAPRRWFGELRSSEVLSTHPRAARHSGSQFQHLLFLARVKLAPPSRRFARKTCTKSCTSPTPSRFCGEGRKRAGRPGCRPGRNFGMQHSCRSGGRGCGIFASETHRRDGRRRNHRDAGDCADRSRCGCRRRYAHRALRAIARRNAHRCRLHGSLRERPRGCQPRRQRACSTVFHRDCQPSFARHSGGAVRASSRRRAPGGKRAGGKFRGSKKERAGRGRKVHAPYVPGRCAHRRGERISAPAQLPHN